MSRKPTVVDLFCGAGGLSHGFMQAGYDVLFGSDIDRTFGQTFLNSHVGAKFVAKSISDLPASEILESCNLRVGELDVLVGGPPCQGYSVYNHGRGEDDPRAGLFKEYIRILEGLQPKWLVMENVTGLKSISGGRLIEEIKNSIKEAGYENVDYQILKAEEYGVPQERRRIVFIANRLGIPIRFPQASHGKGKSKFVSVWDAIGDLPPIFEQWEFKYGADYLTAPSNQFQKKLRGNLENVPNHFGPRLGKINQERLKFIPEGGSWRDIPFDLLPNGMKSAKRSDHTKRYGRPKKEALSCTILTKCDIHWGAYIHPVQDRPFSVREAARIQSFPDSFEFFGSMTEQFVQVGNAVPPFLARAIAECLLVSTDQKILEAA
tara:strand:- start:2718 stop:3848 length:1131 start_codon:yes stop_codon:yes gene_type:complete